MAITAANLTNGSDVDGNSTATTASVTPGSNQLELLTVTTRTNISTDPNTPTITGNGLTWVQVGTIIYDTTSASRKRISIFRAMGASPSAGTISIDFGGQNQTDVVWALDEFSGMDTSGTDGSGAIVQAVTNKDESVTTTSFTVTLAAFSDVNNATYGAIVNDNTGGSATEGSGFTALAKKSSTNLNLVSEFKATNDTTVDGTSVANAMFGGIAVEIKIAAAVTATPLRMLMGIGA